MVTNTLAYFCCSVSDGERRPYRVRDLNAALGPDRPLQMDDLPLAWNDGQDLVVVLEDRNKRLAQCYETFWKGWETTLSVKRCFFRKIKMETCLLGGFTWESTIRWMKRAQNPSKSQKFAKICQNLENPRPFWHFNVTAHFAHFKLEQLWKGKKTKFFKAKMKGTVNVSSLIWSSVIKYTFTLEKLLSIYLKRCYTRVGSFQMLHSRVGSWPYPQTLN